MCLGVAWAPSASLAFLAAWHIPPLDRGPHQWPSLSHAIFCSQVDRVGTHTLVLTHTGTLRPASLTHNSLFRQKAFW